MTSLMETNSLPHVGPIDTKMTTQCDLCGLSVKLEYLKKHKKYVHGNQHHKCKICGIFIKNLAQHKAIKHKILGSGKGSLLSCSYCLKNHQKVADVKSHIQKDHSMIFHCCPQERKITCPTCFKSYKTKKSLWNFHFYHMHMIPRSYTVCPVECCQQNISKTSDNNRLKLHLKTIHKMEISLIFDCSFCPKKFLNQNDLSEHIKNNHKSSQSVVCLEVTCEKTFPDFKVMAVHYYEDHGQVLRRDEEKPQKFINRKTNSLKITKYVIEKEKHEFDNIIELLEPQNEHLVSNGHLLDTTIRNEETLVGTEIVLDNVIEENDQNASFEIDQTIIDLPNNKTEKLTEKNAENDPFNFIIVDGSLSVSLEALTSNLTKPPESCVSPIADNSNTFVEDQEASLSVVSIHDSDDSKLPCPVNNCSSLLSRHALKDHLERHEIGNFACSFNNCQAVLVNKVQLRDHLRRVHLGNPVHCSFEGCSHISKNKQALKSHIYKVHNKKSGKSSWPSGNKTETCTYCGKKLLRKSMSEHVRRFHTIPQYFKQNCPICQISIEKRSLEKHMQRFHTSSMVSCNKCDSVVTKELLEEHLLNIHKLPKLFKYKIENNI